ncbi:MAG: hypothetical protein ACXACB_01225 [Promethearchaeota archaeon]
MAIAFAPSRASYAYNSPFSFEETCGSPTYPKGDSSRQPPFVTD